MCGVENKLEQELLGWTQEIVSFHLPRWAELPEIDLYMDQVIVFSERIFARFPGAYAGKLITPSIINNYVKLGIIPQPVKKKYSRTHIAYLMMICLLKQALPISAITDLIAYQLQYDGIDTVYDRFCDAQEQSVCSAEQNARRDFFEPPRAKDSEDVRLLELTLKMAASANAFKFFAEKAVSLKRREYDLKTEPSEPDDKKARP